MKNQAGFTLLSVIVLSAVLLVPVIFTHRLLNLQASLLKISKQFENEDSNGKLYVKNLESPLLPAWGRLARNLVPYSSEEIFSDTVSFDSLENSKINLGSERLLIFGDLEVSELELSSAKAEIICTGDIRIKLISGTGEKLFLYSFKGEIELEMVEPDVTICEINPTTNSLQLSTWGRKKITLFGNPIPTNTRFGCQFPLNNYFWPKELVLGVS